MAHGPAACRQAYTLVHIEPGARPEDSTDSREDPDMAWQNKCRATRIKASQRQGQGQDPSRRGPQGLGTISRQPGVPDRHHHHRL
jgi:hypothetical protein